MVMPPEIVVEEADDVSSNLTVWSKEFGLRAQFWKGQLLRLCEKENLKIYSFRFFKIYMIKFH